MGSRRLDTGTVALFALTVFLSAYLLFQVQPLIGKFILPWFGGSPAVWTTAMLFFQSVLFGGYVYAHLLARHGSPRMQVGVHVTLLVVAATLAGLVIPDASLKPDGDGSPIGQILLLLGLSQDDETGVAEEFSLERVRSFEKGAALDREDSVGIRASIALGSVFAGQQCRALVHESSDACGERLSDPV